MYCFDFEAGLAGGLFIGLSIGELGFISASTLSKETINQAWPKSPPYEWKTRRGARTAGAAVLLLWSALALLLLSMLSMQDLRDDSLIVYGLFVVWALFSTLCSWAMRRPSGAPALALTRAILAAPALFLVAAGSLIIVLCQSKVRVLFYLSSGMLLGVELLYLYSGVALWLSRKAPTT